MKINDLNEGFFGDLWNKVTSFYKFMRMSNTNVQNIIKKVDKLHAELVSEYSKNIEELKNDPNFMKEYGEFIKNTPPEQFAADVMALAVQRYKAMAKTAKLK